MANMFCEGCLSGDRKLVILDNGLFPVYLSLLERISFTGPVLIFSYVCGHHSLSSPFRIQPLTIKHVTFLNESATHSPTFQCEGIESARLCWECWAVLRRLLRFKQQVNCARSNLLTYLKPKLGSLSNLKVSQSNNIIEINHDSRMSPSAFVKIEEPASPTDSVGDDVFCDDTLNNHRLDCDIDAVYVEDNYPKTDELLTEISNDQKDKSRERSDSFNESDDEPLKLREDKTKQRDRRKKTNDENLQLKEEDKTKPRDRWKTKDDKESKKDRTKLKLRQKLKDGEPLKLRVKDKTKPRGRRKQKNEGDVKVAVKRSARPGVVDSAKVRSKLQRLNVDDEHLEMIVLSWEQVEEERQKALGSEVFLRHEHRCYRCVLGFNHRCKLDDHNAKKHNPALGTEECSVCSVRLADIVALRAHRRRHVVRWRCRVCGAMLSRAETAADHVARSHGGSAPVHTCRVCGHTETSLGRLRVHAKTHSERQKCELCGKLVKNKDCLRTHLFIHKGEKEYACPRCGKQFLFKKAMETHMISHEKSSQLYCHKCDFNFKNQMSFDQHLRYNLNHVDPAKLKYACTLCDKKFVKAARLEEHNLAVHLKMTPVHCAEPGCQFACSSKTVLRTHMRMLHRNARATRNHVCHVCGKAFFSKKILQGHLRRHTGERPFRCSLCPADFGYEAALYNHNKMVHLKTGRSRAAPGIEPATCVEQTTGDTTTALA